MKKGTKRARQYEHVKESAKERGAGASRAGEIAARTVNKERARSGESQQASRTSTEGISSGRRGASGRAGVLATSFTKGPARRKGIEGRSEMSKAQLQKAVDAKE